MYFINLSDLKIKKEFRYENQEISIPLEKNLSLVDVKSRVSARVKDLLDDKPAIACMYIINFKCDGLTADEFLSWVNIAVAEFFHAITSVTGRPRERRLDVPDRLKVVKCNMALLKNAINHQTFTDVFNLHIICGDLEYYLCNEKAIETEKEYKHNLDELEDDYRCGRSKI